MDYTIQKNDSLSKIAQLNNTDVATLVKLNNIKNPNLIQSGSTLKLPTVTPAVNTQQTTITSSSLQPQTKIEIPAPTPTTETPAPTQNLASSFLDELALTQNEKSAQAGQENLIAKMLENITNQSGESAYKTELIKGSGIDTLRKDLQGINSQILKKQAEIAQDDIQLISNMRAEERRDTLLPFAQMGQAKLAGDAQILRALKTSEIGVLNAVALGKQGDIALAKDLVNEAVDAKYAPYKEQNAIYEAQLKAIQPFLTSAEKKQAMAQQFKLTQATKEIDKLSTFQTKALENAISNNAPSNVISKITSATSIEDITKLGGQYITSASDKLDLQLKRAQISKINEEGKTTTTKPLSGEASKLLAISSGLETDINKINAKIDKVGYKKFLQGYLLGTDRETSKLLSSAADKVGRIRSGGAINKDEEKRFLAQFASTGDYFFANPEEAKTAINSVLTEAQTVREGIDPNGTYKTKSTVDTYLDTAVEPTLNNKGTSVSDYLLTITQK